MIYGNKFLNYNTNSYNESGVLVDEFSIFNKNENVLLKQKYRDLSEHCPIITAISAIDSYEDFDSGEDPMLYFKFNKYDEQGIKNWYQFINDNKNKLKEIKDELSKDLNGKSYKEACIQTYEIEVTNKNRNKIINKLKYDLNASKNELNIYTKNIKEDETSLKYLETKYKNDAKKVINDEKIINTYMKFNKELITFSIKLEEACIYAFDISVKEITDLLDKINNL